MIVLMLDFRSISHSLLALSPLVLGVWQMFGVLGLLDIPFNAANMIVLPLILGIGIDNGVHVIHDWRLPAGAISLKQLDCCFYGAVLVHDDGWFLQHDFCQTSGTTKPGPSTNYWCFPLFADVAMLLAAPFEPNVASPRRARLRPRDDLGSRTCTASRRGRRFDRRAGKRNGCGPRFVRLFQRIIASSTPLGAGPFAPGRLVRIREPKESSRFQANRRALAPDVFCRPEQAPRSSGSSEILDSNRPFNASPEQRGACSGLRSGRTYPGANARRLA